MKRVLIFLMMAVATTTQSAAQIKALFEIGLIGSTLRGQSESEFSPIVRFSGGAGVIIDLNRQFQFQPEILYVVKGTRVEGFPFRDHTKVIATIDMTYLEVPLLLVYRFGSTKFRTRLFAGPALAFKLDAQIRSRAATGGPTLTEEDQSVEDRDTGLMFGVGFETDLGGETFMAGLRSSLGFSNTRKDNPDRPDNPPLYNTSIVLFAAIVF